MVNSPQLEVMSLMVYKFSDHNDKNLIPLILTLVEGEYKNLHLPYYLIK